MEIYTTLLSNNILVVCVDFFCCISFISGGVVLAMRAVVASRKSKVEIHISFGQEVAAFNFIFFDTTTHVFIFVDREVAIINAFETIGLTCYITF